MIPEQNPPEAQPQGVPPVTQSDSQNGAPGQGTSRSSRRRRRRRKSKTGAEGETGQSGQQSGPTVQPLEGEVLQAKPAPQQNAQGGFQNGQQQAANGSGKRWKKKQRRRERERPRSAGGEYNPGNQIEPGNSAYGNGGGGFARRTKQKQKGPRSFVGPMDHSYREANGNFADSPPATIEMNGNRSHGKQRRHHFEHDGNVNMLPPELRAPVVNVTIPEDAPTHIYFFVEDLFIAAKINEASRKQGVKVAFLKNDAAVMSHLVGTDESHKPALIVFDLNNTSAKPLTLIPKIRTKLKRSASIIGFLSALQGDLKAKAVEAGCDTVMPRSAFSTSLPNLLRRYGISEDEEPNFNQ